MRSPINLVYLLSILIHTTLVAAGVNITLSRQSVPSFHFSGRYSSSGPQTEIFHNVQPGDCVRRVGIQPGGTGFDYAEFKGLQTGDIATAWGPVRQANTNGPYTGFLSSSSGGSGCRGEAIDTWAEPQGGAGRWDGGRRAVVQGASYLRLRLGNGGGWSADLEGIRAFVSGGAKVAAKVVDSCTAAAVAILEGGEGPSGKRKRDGEDDGAGIGTMEAIFDDGERTATVCSEHLTGWVYPDLIQIDGVDYTQTERGGLIYKNAKGELVDMRIGCDGNRYCGGDGDCAAGCTCKTVVVETTSLLFGAQATRVGRCLKY